MQVSPIFRVSVRLSFAGADRPYPPLQLRVFRSSMIVWALVRVTYVMVLLMSIPPFGLMSFEEGIHFALHPVWPSRLLLIAMTCLLVQLDRKLAHEQLLQANFGVHQGWFVGTSLGGATLSDVAVQTAMHFL